ncbi:MAG: carbohydrate-binding protein, partial [Firmicutes bacterium]|nr:carbohydrate-binding protein [Bacillota bacterium]
NSKSSRIVKLGDDMISLAGTAQTLDAPYIFEDSGINKIGGKYIYSYCSNFNASGMDSGSIQYMTSSSPLSGYSYTGEILTGTWGVDHRGGNNHHSIVALNGKYYIIYHTRLLEEPYNIATDKGGYRCPMINQLTVSGSTISKRDGDRTGVSAVKTLDPYSTVQAETIYRQSGINTSGQGDTVVTDIQKGDWIGVKDVNFAKGASKLTVRVSASGDSAIKVCKGSESGSVIGYVDISKTNGFTDITVPVNNVSGTQDIYFVFGGSLEFDSWYFS